MGPFFEELKERNIIRVAIAYGAFSWLLYELLDLLTPRFALPEMLTFYVLAALAALFLPVLWFCWVFEITPEGLKKTVEVDQSRSIGPRTGRRIDLLALLALLIAGGLFAWERYAVPPPESPAPAAPGADAALDALAADYVRLVLAVGQHDVGYVDAYYGPPEWAEEAEAAGTERPLAELGAEAEALGARIEGIDLSGAGELLRLRARFLSKQLGAVAARIAMLEGAEMSFDEETAALYDAVSPGATVEELEAVLAELEALIPGEGPISERYVAFRDRFVIPPGRVDAVFSAAIAACRERTLRHIDLPPGESFTVAYVTDKAWSGYNWYQGGAESRIEINLDFPIHIDRAVGLGCHEGYPGHHTFNALLEQRFAKERGWLEFTVYPLYSPQSFLAEGTANYGIDMAFPGPARMAFEREVLYPLAGIDPALAADFGETKQLLRKLRYARTEGARRYLDGEMSREATIAWLARYGLVSKGRAEQGVRFIEQYRGYVINYTLGADLVRAYVERNSEGDPESRWAAYEMLLTTPLTASAIAAPE